MAENVGSIEYIARISTSQLKKDAKETQNIAKKTGDDMGNELDRGSDKGSAALAKLGSAAKVAGLAIGALAATGITLAVKAAFSQVDAVQQATVALNAYEKDAGKVSKTLSDLIKFARSDMGVLFQRQDLFKSAQALKIMGDNTDDLVGHVKILSRSVGLGLSNWDDLNLIVGRVGSTSRLTGEDFDNLTKAGFKLDPALRNTNINFEQLFKQLDKGIPADALAGQSETIRGKMVKLQSAFRDVGSAILGVDKETSKFKEGGIGASFVTAIDTAQQALKRLAAAIPQIKQNISEVAGIVKSVLGPSFDALWNTVEFKVVPALDKLMPLFKLIGAFVGVYLVAQTWLWINVLNVLANVFGYVGQVVGNTVQWMIDRWRNVVSIWSQAPGFFRGVANAIGQALSGVTDAITSPFVRAYNYIKTLPRKFAEIFTGVGGMIRDSIGNIDIPGPAGKIRDVIPGFASGVRNFGGGLAVVGEKGPELVNLPSGSDVYSNGESRAMAGGSVNVTLNMSGILARSRSDLREIGKDILRSVNEELVSKGKPAIGGIS